MSQSNSTYKNNFMYDIVVRPSWIKIMNDSSEHVYSIYNVIWKLLLLFYGSSLTIQTEESQV